MAYNMVFETEKCGMVYYSYGSESDASTSSSASSINPVLGTTSINGYNEPEIHSILEGWKLTAEERRTNGYPEFGEDSQFAAVNIPATSFTQGKRLWIDPSEKLRLCSRCNVHFVVDNRGEFPNGSNICQYKARGEKKSADTHVTAQRFTTELKKFQTTAMPHGEMDVRSRKVYGLDCEMVLTTGGPALARASLVDIHGALVMDILVKPEHRVLDPCTEFSGLTIEMVEQATGSIESVHEALSDFVNAGSMLVGHGLESDLKALRLLHWNVVDTAVLFPDASGKKVRLQQLAWEHLGRRIQSANESTEGHCSYEDALVCIDLIKHHISLSG